MNAWIVRAGIILFVLALYKASPELAGIIIGISAAGALAMFLIKGRHLPGALMDILDRLTNKSALEAAYEAKKSKLDLIDAEVLGSRIAARVVGQDDVVRSVATQLRRRLAASRKDKPIAVFCFAGPPGVGKTHLAKVLAEELYGDKGRLQFFDMSQYSQPHAAASLFGQARGYVGSQNYGALTAALRDTPESVVLLDEFEKAHPEVHKRFLTAWNDGFIMELSDGSKVPTRDAIFILTTNAAARRIGELSGTLARDDESLDRAVKSALQDAQFAPEVLSRIDQVFPFRPLEGLDIARVIALEAENLARQFGMQIEQGGIEPTVLVDLIDHLADRMVGGIRDVSRSLERLLGDSLIEARRSGASVVRIVSDQGMITVKAAAAKPAATMAA